MDLFRAAYGFVNSDLAAVYKVPAPASRFRSRRFPPEQERAGILGQALFLTLTSKPEDTAPTVARLIHSRTVSVPASASAPAGRRYKSSAGQRESTRNQSGTARGTCRQSSLRDCHSLIDPIGFGLEKFDAIGVRREKAKLLFYPDVHEAKIPKKTVELDLDITGRVAGIENSEFTNSRQIGRDSRWRPSNARNAWSGRCSAIWRAGTRHPGRRARDPPSAGRVPALGISVSSSYDIVSRAADPGPERGLQMANSITRRVRLSRRLFLKGLTAAQSP